MRRSRSNIYEKVESDITCRWRPTAFEEEPLERGIDLINSRPHRPQTNGKLKRRFGTLEECPRYHKSLEEYVDYCNEARFHRSLDFDRCETPMEAFHKKKATEAIRQNDPKWMERDQND